MLSVNVSREVLLKKLLLVALFLAPVLQALPNYRLEFRLSPYQSWNYKESLLVDDHGQVIFKSEGDLAKILLVLSPEEMRQIEEEISIAREGDIVTHSDICEVVPHTTYEYSADNGMVVLGNGSVPCGGMQINISAAAKQLRLRLVEWRSLHN